MIKKCIGCGRYFKCNGDQSSDYCEYTKCECPECTWKNAEGFGIYNIIEGCFSGISDPYDVPERYKQFEKKGGFEMSHFCLNLLEKTVLDKEGKQKYTICINNEPQGDCENCVNWIPAYPCKKNEDIAEFKIKNSLIIKDLVKKFRESGQLFADISKGDKKSER